MRQEELGRECVLADVRGERGMRLIGQIGHLRPQRFEGAPGARQVPLLLQPQAEAGSRIGKAAMMCVNEVPDAPWLIGFLGEQHTRAFVIGATSRFSGFVPQQVALPSGVGLAHVVPETGEESQVTAAERARSPTREFGDAPQVINQELPLAAVVCRVRVERLGSQSWCVTPAAHGMWSKPIKAASKDRPQEDLVGPYYGRTTRAAG